MKRIFAAALALACLTGAAFAEVYAGVTVASVTATVSAASGGTVGAVFAEPGALVAEGDTLATLRTSKVFAAEDGTIARILAKEGAQADGTVLELAPVSRYTIHCTVDGVDSAAAARVHVGEALYLRCTADGSHRGTGTITQIDGAEYLVEATGGTFYVGEAVNLYRDAEFTASQRAGAGTVVASDPRDYEATGTIIRMHVAEGEYVERGELLFEFAESEAVALTAPVAGIVTEAAAPGDALQAGQSAFAIAAIDGIQVEFYVDETAAARLSPGEAVELIRADDADEVGVAGAIISVSRVAEEELYAVRVVSEAPLARLGLTVHVRTKESPEASQKGDP